MGITVYLPEPVCTRRQSALCTWVVFTEGGNCYGENQSKRESNGQNDREASCHRPSMSGAAQAAQVDFIRGGIKMNTPIVFTCEKCGEYLRSKDQTPSKVICPKCGHENTSPEGYTPPDSVSIQVKNRYFGE